MTTLEVKFRKDVNGLRAWAVMLVIFSIWEYLDLRGGSRGRCFFCHLRLFNDKHYI